MNNDGPSGTLTHAEKQRLVERHVEVMEMRKLEEDLRLLDMIKAARILAPTFKR